jgi:glutaminyl-peptide cyclotransferase
MTLSKNPHSIKIIKFFLLVNILLCLLAYGTAKAGEFQKNNSYSLPHQEDALRVDADNAFNMLKQQVAIGPRSSGSDGAKKCAEYIVSKAREYGYEPVVDEWTQNTPSGPVTFRNIYAELPGSKNGGEGFILLASHYDTKKIPEVPEFAGANDAASSTALLLEIMRVVSARPWSGRTLRFVFFDGEEAMVKYSATDGLYGSRRLADHYRKNGLVKQCRAMILLDMVGDRDLTITLPKNTSEELALALLKTAEKQGVKDYISFLPYRMIDDHLPFERLGIPVIDLIDFQYGNKNEHWHKATDTLDNVSGDSLEIVGNLVLGLIQELKNAD